MKIPLIVCTFGLSVLAGCASSGAPTSTASVVKLDVADARRIEGEVRDSNAIPKSGVVTQIMTPDEFVLDGKWQVQLAGVDSPIAAPSQRVGDYYGKAAFEAVQKRLLNKQVSLSYDVYAKDFADRLIAHVALPDGTDLNEYMIKNGYGLVACIPPNKRNCRRFIELQHEAVAKRLGMWDIPDVQVDETMQRQGRRFGRVAGISDGDTIRLASGITVRYIGIDSPEEKDQLYQSGTLAQLAHQRNASLVDNKEVELEYDVDPKDPRGRDLAYVYVRLPNGERVMVNEVLVAEGLAWVAVFPPNVARIPELLDAQRQAMEAGLGVWRTEDLP